MAEIVKTTDNMLVRNEHLDKLLLLAGEVIVASSNQERIYRALRERFERRTPVDREAVDASRDLAETSALISTDLHRLVQAIRTVTLKDFGFRARRQVRDIARKTGKCVQFIMEGDDTTVDKNIVERLFAPVSHQLRNAIDHGIEDPAAREAAGKPPEGRVTLRAYNSERETFIEIEDDGAGIDLESVRQIGIRAGHIGADDPFDSDTALAVMCAPGVSTAREVSEVSGRGVGMDAVMTGISDLGGSVSFRTERGHGSCFTFRAPLVSAVNIVDGLVVRAGVYLLAFPILNIVGTLSLTRAQVHTALGRGESIQYLGGLLPLRALSDVLDGIQGTTVGDTVHVLVVEHKTTRFAFAVSEFLAPQKLVIIPIDGMGAMDGIAGGTILAGKQMGFIIDVPRLMDMALGKSRPALTAPRDAGLPIPPPLTDAERSITPGAPPPPPAKPVSEADAAASSRQLREFMEEVERLLPELNESVFQVEANPNDSDLINTAFRLFHTIKGNFLMTGFAKGSETVHAVESVLDLVRRKEITMAPEVIDVLMDGAAFIEERVRQARDGAQGDVGGQEIIEQAKAFIRPSAVSPESYDPASAEMLLSSEAQHRLLMLRRAGKSLYTCFLRFESTLQPPFITACLIYRRFCEAGETLGSSPPMAEVERGVSDGRFRILFSTSLDLPVVEKALRDMLMTHYGVTHMEFARYR